MISHLVVCIGIELGRLDAAMERLAGASFSGTRWLIASEDMERLGTFHDLWQQRMDVIACLLPPWSLQSEAALDAIVDHERRVGEVVLLVHPAVRSPNGALSRYVAQGQGIAIATTASDRDIAALLSVRFGTTDPLEGDPG